MKTPITPEALIELGFKKSGQNDYAYRMGFSAIQVYGDIVVDIYLLKNWHETNATTIEDIKDLIRLFK
jgi:hypothetical protein